MEKFYFFGPLLFIGLVLLMFWLLLTFTGCGAAFACGV